MVKEADTHKGLRQALEEAVLGVGGSVVLHLQGEASGTKRQYLGR